MDTNFVVTPWRNRAELLEVRKGLFGDDLGNRVRAVNQVCDDVVRKLCMLSYPICLFILKLVTIKKQTYAARCLLISRRTCLGL